MSAIIIKVYWFRMITVVIITVLEINEPLNFLNKQGDKREIAFYKFKDKNKKLR